jgi:predicted ATPase
MALIFSKWRPVSLSSLLWFDSLLPTLFNTCFWSFIPTQKQNNKIQKTAHMYTKSFKLLLLDKLDVEQIKGAMVVGHLV